MKMLSNLNKAETTVLTHSTSNAVFDTRIVNLLDGQVVTDLAVCES